MNHTMYNTIDNMIMIIYNDYTHDDIKYIYIYVLLYMIIVCIIILVMYTYNIYIYTYNI